MMIDHIQGLRGVAIISVVLFHLWPTWFPNGFLGVDIFFILSGFLMALIFSKESKVSLRTAYEFYCKRIQRIFSLYYLIVPIIFIFCQIFLSKGWISVNNGHAYYSMSLLKNMETIWLDSDYFLSFSMGAPQKDLYLHTWSLSVEIQFYLVVPLIFWILYHFSSKANKICVLTFVSIISCVHYYTGKPTVSFNCPLARMWQFCIGMIAFMYTETTQEGYQKVNFFIDHQRNSSISQEASALVTVLLLLTISLPLPDLATRPIISLLTGYLLTVKNGTDLFKKVLQNQIITYIGDISYTIYLVHWPVILLLVGYDLSSYVFAIFYIIVISYFLFHFYESFYRSLSRKDCFLLIAGLLLLNAGLYYSVVKTDSAQKIIETVNTFQLEPELEDIVKRNEALSKVYIARGPMKYNQTASAVYPGFNGFWGIYDFPKGHGTKKILVIGNSYALMEADLIRQEFEGNYSEFRMIAGLSLFVLYETKLNPPPGQHDAALKALAEFEPDNVFITTRYEDSQKKRITVQNITEDEYVKEYNKNIERIEELTKGTVFIQGPTPNYQVFHLTKYIDALISREDLSRFHLTKEVADTDMLPSLLRLKGIQCKKCEVYDTASTLIEADWYLGFDPVTKMSFVDNSIHMTDPGMERWRPVYRRIAESL